MKEWMPPIPSAAVELGRDGSSGVGGPTYGSSPCLSGISLGSTITVYCLSYIAYLFA